MSDLSEVNDKTLKQQKLIQNAISIMVVPKQQESKLLSRNCWAHDRIKGQLPIVAGEGVSNSRPEALVSSPNNKGHSNNKQQQ